MKRFLSILSLALLLFFPLALVAQDKNGKEVEVKGAEVKKEKKEEVATPVLNVVNNKLSVKNAPVGKRLEILSILGNKVMELEIKSVNEEFELNLPKAIYIFRLEGTVRKFVVR